MTFLSEKGRLGLCNHFLKKKCTIWSHDFNSLSSTWLSQSSSSTTIRFTKLKRETGKEEEMEKSPNRKIWHQLDMKWTQLRSDLERSHNRKLSFREKKHFWSKWEKLWNKSIWIVLLKVSYQLVKVSGRTTEPIISSILRIFLDSFEI